MASAPQHDGGVQQTSRRRRGAAAITRIARKLSKDKDRRAVVKHATAVAATEGAGQKRRECVEREIVVTAAGFNDELEEGEIAPSPPPPPRRAIVKGFSILALIEQCHESAASGDWSWLAREIDDAVTWLAVRENLLALIRCLRPHFRAAYEAECAFVPPWLADDFGVYLNCDYFVGDEPDESETAEIGSICAFWLFRLHRKKVIRLDRYTLLSPRHCLPRCANKVDP